jgi:hypothetical protein
MTKQPRRERAGAGAGTKLGAIALALAAGAAPAAAGPDSAGTLSAALATDRPRIGAMADVGVPDGATVSIVYRPIRAHAGISHNLISLGERAGEMTISQ